MRPITAAAFVSTLLPRLIDLVDAGPTGGSVANLAIRSNDNDCISGQKKKPNFVYIIADE